jgi:hypothetical protein
MRIKPTANHAGAINAIQALASLVHHRQMDVLARPTCRRIFATVQRANTGVARLVLAESATELFVILAKITTATLELA